MAPAGLPNNNSNTWKNRKGALSFSFSQASLQHKENSAEERVFIVLRLTKPEKPKDFADGNFGDL